MSLKISLVSNYLTIHQIAICQEFSRHDGVDFKFVSSFKPSGEKTKYSNFEFESFVLRAYESEQSRANAIERILESDVVIFGSGDLSLLKNKKQLIFFYSEHLTKKRMNILRAIHLNLMYKKFSNSYLLCSSSFTAADYNSIGLFKNRCFYYGYFPLLQQNTHSYSDNGFVRVLWVGRELDWKHPEYAFEAAKILYDNNIKSSVTIVSSSETYIKDLITQNKDKPWFANIEIIDSLSNALVQKKMSESDIYIFSSDKREGWGAVVNEAMNAGCCVLASTLAGCTKYLIVDGQNGFYFSNKEEFQNVLLKAVSSQKYIQIGKSAHATISEKWNEKEAVCNLCNVFKTIINKEPLKQELINNGPGTKIQ